MVARQRAMFGYQRQIDMSIFSIIICSMTFRVQISLISLKCNAKIGDTFQVHVQACGTKSIRTLKIIWLARQASICLQNINYKQNMRKVLHKCIMKCFTKSRCFIFRSSHHICGVKISMNNQMDHKNVFMKNFIYWVEQKRLFFELIMLFLKR